MPLQRLSQYPFYRWNIALKLFAFLFFLAFCSCVFYSIRNAAKSDRVKCASIHKGMKAVEVETKLGNAELDAPQVLRIWHFKSGDFYVHFDENDLVAGCFYIEYDPDSISAYVEELYVMCRYGPGR